MPREGRVTGRTDIHDIAIAEIDGAPRPIFVNTLFSCLATISDTASFRPVWRPKFISDLAPEDRCHLNGLAMDGKRPAYRQRGELARTSPTAGASGAATAAW